MNLTHNIAFWVTVKRVLPTIAPMPALRAIGASDSRKNFSFGHSTANALEFFVARRLAAADKKYERGERNEAEELHFIMILLNRRLNTETEVQVLEVSRNETEGEPRLTEAGGV